MTPPPFPVLDGHVDLLYAMQSTGVDSPFAGLVAGPVTPAGLARGGVRVLVAALYCADVHNGPGSAAAHLRNLMAFADRNLAGFIRPRTVAQLEICWQGGSPPGLLFLLENGDALADGDLDHYGGWGVKVVGLTHAGANRLADGNGVASPGGLRPAGRRLLPELARRGWAVDVAHLADPGLREVLADYPGPLLCSHTGLRRFCARPRNLADDLVAALLERGAVIGLALAPEMLVEAGPANLETVFAQLDWLVQRFGDGGVGLGSDFGGFDGICAGLQDHGALGRLAARMARAGYPPESIGRIMGGNWLRFYGELLGP